jgi:hypothetical protein
MKPTKFRIACIILPLFIALCVGTASAAGSGTLAATDALQIRGGEDGHVFIFLNGSYDPAVGGLELSVFYNESIAEATTFVRNPEAGSGVTPRDLSSGFSPQLANDVGIPTETWLWDITFRARVNDGSVMTVGLVPSVVSSVNLPPDDYLSVTAVHNATFSTKDEVLPVINITTPVTVSPTFNIAGTIYDVGGMGTAQATLKNTTHAAVTYDLTLNGLAPTCTFSEQVTWPIEDGVTLTVTATDDAGNTNTSSQVINVVDVGFSNPEPTGYINATPAQAQAFMSQIDKTEPITMYLGSATYGPTRLTLDTTTDYAKGDLPNDLVDGEYWVNVSGTDNFGDERCLNWTFTLDATAPVINSFTITDSDGDGYIEAEEDLTLTWVATDRYFKNVTLMDVNSREVLWSSDDASGSDTIQIDDGNRDLAFRAYDRAGNYDSRAFHLYYDYMIWVNSTKVGEVSGIDTTYTAAKDLSRTAVSSITLYNGCTVPLPSLETLERTVTNLGQVTSDTYVTADNTANRTLVGNETYQTAWVYNPGKTFDFSVKVAHAPRAVLVLGEANESYIADLINAGKGGINSIDYTELIQKTAYIFIEGGWAKVAVDDNGKITMPAQSGNAITTGSGSIAETLRHSKNQVNLDTGYRLSTQNLDAITLAPGDYALAAITMDGDRIGLLAAMPVIVMESGDQGAIDPVTVKQNETFTAQFTYDTPCERLGVVLLRDVTYEGTAFIDAAKLSKDKGTLKQALKLNITHGGIPATQKLIGNIYVSPSSGKYAVANTNKATISTSGLEPGSYHVYMIGQSKNGTVQAYGMHTLEITTETTPKPTPKPPSGGGGGGGGSSPTYTSYTGTGTLTVNNVGTVLRSIKVNADDKVGSLLVPIGVKALDKDGKPLTSITLTPLASDKMPAVPSGALFKFAGYVYEAGPDGATFEPGITLAFDLPADAWNALDPDNNDFKVKWYNEETEEWEDVPTTTYKSTRSVDAEITHFSTFALFTEPVTTPTETPTPPVDIDTPTTPPGDEKPPAGEFPTTIFAIVVVLVIVIAAGYFFIVRK